MTAYEFKTEKFQGPLEKLLELIEDKKLEITEISLAEVTNDFLQYLKTLTDADNMQTNAEGNAEQSGNLAVNQIEIRENLRLLADFIAIAGGDPWLPADLLPADWAFFEARRELNKTISII